MPEIPNGLCTILRTPHPPFAPLYFVWVFDSDAYRVLEPICQGPYLHQVRVVGFCSLKCMDFLEKPVLPFTHFDVNEQHFRLQVATKVGLRA
ncbi:MAG: hypothetical protein KDK65_07010 [Chlamydiia bacterium]|nr:hypothetical protein [Chlamydiia bacterium]